MRRRHEAVIRKRACSACGTHYKTSLPDAYFAQNAERDLCTPCTQTRSRHA